MFALDGKTAVISGAASGIGRACARRLAEAGSHVVVLDIDDDGGNRAAAEVGGRFLHTDVADSGSVAEAMAEAARETGQLDIVVNNAGIALPLESVTETTPEHFTQHFEVNTLGVVNGMRHAASYMPDGGAIINTSSILGVLGIPGYTSYAASKFAVVGVTKVAAAEFGVRGIRVNCVCPTTVDTEMLETFPDAQQESIALRDASTLHRIIDAEHVAALVHFLAADDCPVISGQAIMIDCGVTSGISATAWKAAGETG